MSTRGDILLGLARAAVAETLGMRWPLPPAATIEASPWLQEPAATFVTIERGEQLHGCIGTIEAHRPLREDVVHNARMAAFRDPRSRPLRADEFPSAHFSVSVLGPRSPLRFTTEAEARAALRPEIDGLVLRWRGHRGVFLPQVWGSLPTPREFLDHLKRKAGLGMDFWAADVQLERFEVDKYFEPHHAQPPSARDSERA
ncbi:AmmeMemoRadiSam system protein A [Pseudenhygromyxa sp. WMMC2535]|uniref:AmmeMemoRadiSam system protein A n=1 Tax=Pseudenhygromyxa sp. WMMC2535 TaxID=2712867 RepID=UPI001555385E|nr:AmmeMemoRadiSam system protein A [Pseudenhygromyxa sp. WMMC2535]NVB40410.1 AmmeMemoRadiSam system protein A [Pseudenhygromyxa sp. WMMC2535]